MLNFAPEKQFLQLNSVKFSQNAHPKTILVVYAHSTPRGGYMPGSNVQIYSTRGFEDASFCFQPEKTTRRRTKCRRRIGLLLYSVE